MAVHEQDEVLAGEEVAALLAAARRAIAERDAKIAAHEAALVERDAKIAAHEAELAKRATKYEALREAYRKLEHELLLMKRRIFVAKAERVDTAQLELEFATLSKKLEALAGLVGEAGAEPSAEATSSGDATDPSSVPTGEDGRKPRRGRRSKGRRNLAEADLPEVEVVVADPIMEDLVARGLARRVSTVTSYRLGRQPAVFFKVRVERVVYATCDDNRGSELFTAELPPELISRTLAAPSLLADIAARKFHDGMPLYRQEQNLGLEAQRLDRGTMSRWLNEVGGALGATVVTAMDRDAKDNAFCMATDATGFAVQPGPREQGEPRRPCRKGHYFVRIADSDHILFDYTARHTSAVVRAMFKGYEGSIQADACSVYDALFRPASEDDPDGDGCTRREVGCWSHCRTKFFEAAFAKEALAREGLLRISRLFEVDAEVCRRGRPPPSTVQKRRAQHLAPLIDEFMAFAKEQYEREKGRRGPLRRAFGYAVRQERPLRAVLEDGRLVLDNNRSERELRKVVRIRDASLFAGSDEHAESAGAFLSLIASAKLHDLNPVTYLRDVIRVLPFWPRDRYLELAPKYWRETRSRIDPRELAAELGYIRVPHATASDTAE